MIDVHIMFQNREKHIYVQIVQNVICIKFNATKNVFMNDKAELESALMNCIIYLNGLHANSLCVS